MAATADSKQTLIALVVLCMLAVLAAGFYFYPNIDLLRSYVDPKHYVPPLCDCLCVLALRPWYVQFNYWWWISLAAVPVIIFSLPLRAPLWCHALRILLGFLIGYILLVFSEQLSSEILHAPFSFNSLTPYPAFTKECINSGGGGLFFLVAWIPTIAYLGFWENIRWLAYKKKCGTLDVAIDYNIFSKILIWVSLPLTIVLALLFIFIFGSLIFS